ncbi:hypothetical protein AMTR_s00091p00076380 [Amborella trichopoda]|uniref:Uncharacterized protein n=1 Tax=Amborella trichopoda TaxID=13333 RepID=W1NZ06_AMBTC|nr:hypothetical protein AMTR_s00091p00076380 [Amborella trichopoda]
MVQKRKDERAKDIWKQEKEEKEEDEVEREGDDGVSSSFFYKSLIRHIFYHNEKLYELILDIVESRWDSKLERPLHLAGDHLNHAYCYDNPQIETQGYFMDAINTCVVKLIPPVQEQDQVSIDLEKYRTAMGTLGTKLALRQRKTLKAGKIL